MTKPSQKQEPGVERVCERLPPEYHPTRIDPGGIAAMLGGGMSTWIGLHYHLVFSTKHREPWFGPELRARLHEYLGGTVKGLGGEIRGVGGVGGVADHVHLLVSLQATHRLADFMRELKKASSVWLKESVGLPGFAWQDGYCAITVSPSARPAVHDYIERQEEHHRHRDFQEELTELLQKAGIAYNPRYLE